MSYGIGPRKIGTGPDNAVAAFRPRMRSSSAPLAVQVVGQNARDHPVVTDVNQMARDHRWNNLQDVRLAKSAVGKALLFGGLIVADQGLYRRNGEVAAIAGGVALLGALLRAGAHADTRYNDILPQRYYVVPLTLASPDNSELPTENGYRTVMLGLRGMPSARLMLTGLTPPSNRSGTVQLRYVRLIGGGYATLPDWSSSGRILYGNPHTGPASPTPLPFILGGDDVQLPSEDTLDQYQAAGHLQSETLASLESLYRERGITWTIEDTLGYADRHILEGGSSLVAPLPGTTGFARLFGGEHPPFRGVTPPPQPKKPQPFD